MSLPPTDTLSYVQRCRLEAVQGLKEAVCGLPLIRFSNQDLAPHLPVAGMPGSYELPDGTPIDLSPEVRNPVCV